MRNYIVCDDIYCWYLAKNKKDLLDYVKIRYKAKDFWAYWTLDELNIWYIDYNAKKVKLDNFFWDLIAMDKTNDDEVIEYDDYSKFWIKDWIMKKDFLYYNL